MGRPKQERAVQTREAVLRAAAEVFDEFGFSAASINKILQRAGVTAGALYFHFDSKEALAQAVMNAQPETIMPRMATAGLQRLVDITLVWSRQLQVDPLLRAGVRLTTEQATSGVQDGTPYRDWQRIMSECLAESEATGELQAGVDPQDVAAFVVEACTGMQTVSAVLTGRRDLIERTVRMWQLLLPGIAVSSVIARTVVTSERVEDLLA